MPEGLRQAVDDAVSGVPSQAATDDFKTLASHFEGIATTLLQTPYQFELEATRLATLGDALSNRVWVAVSTASDGLSGQRGMQGIAEVRATWDNAGAPSAGALFIVTVGVAAMRRRRNFSEAAAVMETFCRYPLSNQPLLTHLRAVSLTDGQCEDVVKATELAEQAIHDYEETGQVVPPGTLHAAASAYSRLLEMARRDPLVVDQLCKKFKVFESADAMERTVALGTDLIKRAIAGNPERGRFFYTSARLKLFSDDFDGARDDILRAIQLEITDRDAEDFHERATEYLALNAAVDTQEKLKQVFAETRMQLTQEINEQASRITAQIDDIRSRQDSLASQAEGLEQGLDGALTQFADAQIRLIEVLVFFTAALALIQAGVTIGKGAELWERIILLVLLGAILLGFVVAGGLFLNRRTTNKS